MSSLVGNNRSATGPDEFDRALCSSQVQGYAIYKDGQYAAVRYPTEGYTADVAGRSFHHGRFVQKLRQRAAAQPSVTCREATVRKLINGEWHGAQQQQQQQQYAGVERQPVPYLCAFPIRCCWQQQGTTGNGGEGDCISISSA